MAKIELLYKHHDKDKKTHLEECVDELNKQGGLKRSFPNEEGSRIPLVVDIEENDTNKRRIIVYAKSLGRNDIDNRIDAEYDKKTGKEVVEMPYGFCGLHLYFERNGFSTNRRSK